MIRHSLSPYGARSTGRQAIAPLKLKGDRAEIEVARDLLARGYRIAFPYGEDWDFDLIFCRAGKQKLERVQVKYTESNGEVVFARCRSSSLTNGKVKRIKRYTARTIDWLAIYDLATDCCYYVPAGELGAGMDVLTLRLAPPRNCQRIGIRYAAEYLHPLPAQTDHPSG